MLLWLSAFTSPSLHSLAIMPSAQNTFAEFSLSTISTIFAIFAKKCHRLQVLFHPFSLTQSGASQPNTDQPAASQMLIHSRIYRNLESMRHLAVLSLEGTFITPGSLAVISRLPRLYNLNVAYNSGNYARVMRTVQLPDESFPSLRFFSLQCHTMADILAVWDLLPLVKNLLRLYLYYRPHPGTDIDSLFTEPGTGMLFPLICERSPNLRDIHLGQDSVTHSTLTVPSSPYAWSHMSRLPLSRLKLVGFNCDELFLKGVSGYWSNVTQLYLQNAWLSLSHLTHLSRLPKLQHLITNLDDFAGPMPRVEGVSRSLLHTIDIPIPLVLILGVDSPGDAARLVWITHLHNHHSDSSSYQIPVIALA
jgi:hypothetical protein